MRQREVITGKCSAFFSATHSCMRPWGPDHSGYLTKSLVISQLSTIQLHNTSSHSSTAGENSNSKGTDIATVKFPFSTMVLLLYSMDGTDFLLSAPTRKSSARLGLYPQIDYTVIILSVPYQLPSEPREPKRRLTVTACHLRC